MRRLIAMVTICLAATAVVAGPPVAAAPPPRSIAISGTGAAMYPAFDPDITRYAVTTTGETAGQLTLTPTPAPGETVLVQGAPADGPVALTGLGTGDEVSVIFTDGSVSAAYSIVYLPAEFPRLDVTGGARASFHDVAPGLIGLTLNAFNFSQSQPEFNTIVDRNGVPAWVAEGTGPDLDLKQQPTGEITLSRPTNVPGRTGVSLVVLDDQLQESERLDVRPPLTNTDGHDAIRLTNGDTVLIGYEPNPVTGKIDATIQTQDADGDTVFSWSSAAYAAETVAMPSDGGDYAHINSVVPVGPNNDLMASFRHLSSVYLIATVAHDGYQPGDVIWKLGGRDSDFSFVDDPFPGGPCAQHTASMLPNGHVLIFDNGTSSYCVDPGDPAGPTLARAQTRVTEYALDTVAHTATLVWSYAPAGRHAFFAGSARRLSNGNTLIGWSADRTALASEVDTAGDTLWELTAAAPTRPGDLKYMTYRAEPIDLPDAIDPVVGLDLPAGGVYLEGGSVAPTWSCTDRGGSSLRSCTVTGLVDGRLSGVPGQHTVSVTGTDGAGNTTTVTSGYTVRAGRRVADGQVRVKGAWIGDGIYGGAGHQKVAVKKRSGRKAVVWWRVRNDGEIADRFRLGGGPTKGFKVRYLSGSKNVTRAVRTGGLTTPVLAPGATFDLRVVITPTSKAKRGGHRKLVLRAQAPGAVGDQVAVTVTRRR